MNLKKLNKKAALGPQTMIFLFLLNLFLIAAGISWGILAFFTSDYDFREVDATLITSTIEQCLTKNNIEFVSKEQFASDFYKTCKINKAVTDESFFIHIEFSPDKIYESGPGDLTQCALAEKNVNYPKCFVATIEEKNIFIKAGSNQHSKRIKT
jgi:hypothetical protein